ncbi:MULTISPECIES: DUF2637 domain-containing protein [unclassified Streptomyces]|uniref:DUF2637 domain-containing protein n=1 Tax=unclassified Streptomyces TaxID=2593676 RepID=UPI001F0D2F8C|nr:MULTISPECIES: DUF2637 domain-containing protein [unclassified Streptomyces]
MNPTLLPARANQEQETTAKPAVPPLSGWERLGAGLTVLGGAAVGGLGFYASFDGVSDAAAAWGFSDPWVLPAAIDSAIPVFTVAGLLLIRMGMPLWWARIVPWALSLITCALNVAVGTTLWSKIAHGSMALLWVAVSEIAAHVYAARIGAYTGRRRQMDKVRWARWFLSPVPTFRLWRRMKLWELTSYDEVLRLEQERLFYRALLHGRYGRAWRRKAPVEAVLPLQLVNAGIPLSETAHAGLRAADIEPTGVFARPVDPVETLPAPAPAAETAPVEDTLFDRDETRVPVAAAVPAAKAKPRPLTVTVPAEEQAPAAPAAQERRALGEEAYAELVAQMPAWSNEEELQRAIAWTLDGGHRELFSGPLTGAEIAKVLGQHEATGRKVRTRLVKTHAAQRNIALPPRPSIDEIFQAFAEARTSAPA